MRKYSAFILIFIIAFQSISFGENSITKDELVLLIDSSLSFINGNLVSIDKENQNVVPIIIENRTYLPVRYIAESLGGTVGWNASSEEVTITTNNTVIRFRIGSNHLYVNDSETSFDNPPFIKQGRTFVQLSTLLIALDKEVFYKEGIIIISDSKPMPSDNYLMYLKNQLNKQDKMVLTNNEIFSDASKSVVSISTENNGSATGFFVTEDLILTNYHVANNAGEITAKSSDNFIHNIEGIYWYDLINDMVLLKTEASNSKNWLTIEENDISIGDKVLTIGDPLGLINSFSEGIISAFRLDPFYNTIKIQTDVSASFGSSGSPLLNEKGNVVGIITSGLLNEEINFASKVRNLNDIINNELERVDESVEFVSTPAFTDMRIRDLVENTISAIIDNDRDLYNSYFIENAPFIGSKDDSFLGITKTFGGEGYSVSSINQVKVGDTYIVSYEIMLDKNRLFPHIFLYHITYNPETDQFKVVGNITLSSLQWIVRLDVDLEKILDPNDEIPGTIEVSVRQKDIDKAITFANDLNFEPHDFIYDSETESIFMTDRENKLLIKYELDTQKKEVLTFEQFPEKMTLVKRKLYLVLPDSEHNNTADEIDTSGYVGIVDTTSFTMDKIIEVDVDPYDVAVMDDIMYIACGSSQGTRIISMAISKEEILSEDNIRQRSNIEIHPKRNQLYTITTDSSPRDYTTYLIDEGKITSHYDSPYHGDYDLLESFRISSNGRYIINYSGIIFSNGYDRDSDLRYYKSLYNEFSSLIFDEESNRMFASIKGENRILVYDLHSFEVIESIETKGKIFNMAINQNKLFAVENYSEYFGLNEYDISNVGTGSEDKTLKSTLTIDSSRKLHMIPEDYYYDSETHSIFMTDRSSNSLVKYDIADDSMMKVILDYPAKRIFVSDGRIYLTLHRYGHNRSSDTDIPGYYAILDTTTLEVIAINEIDLDPYDIVALDSHVVISGGSSQSARLNTYEIETNKKINTYYIREKTTLDLQETTNKIYAHKINPYKPEVYVIEEGEFVLPHEETINFPMQRNISENCFISPDGKYNYYDTGLILTSNTRFEEDNIYYASLETSFSSLAFDLSNDRFYVGLEDSRTINIYKYSTNELIDTLKTEGKVEFIQVVGNQLITIQNNQEVYYLHCIQK